MEWRIFEAAAYLLNRSPTRRLDWQSPLGKLQELSAIRNPRPKLAHLHAYGCRAYALRYDLNKLDRLESRVHIGYLVGYESTNIFKIWVPALHRVINARDVTFDDSKRFQQDEDFSDVTEQVVRPLELQLDEDEAEPLIQLPSVSAERSIDATNDTIIVDSGRGIEHGTSLLPTPQQSPEPDLQKSPV